jgi:hypothetical protein
MFFNFYLISGILFAFLYFIWQLRPQLQQFPNFLICSRSHEFHQPTVNQTVGTV